jgi:demethylmenaquinone methyltransferase/2-methoxy-6-polyprenyl-1,4-benzoquinol methylase
MTRATLDKDPAEVAAMFDEVAARYDLTNTVLSLGQDRGWRRAVAEPLDLKPGERVLDLAAGTATSSAALARSGADVIACDFTSGCCAWAAAPGTRASSSSPATRCSCPSPTRPSTPSPSASGCATPPTSTSRCASCCA